MKRTRLALIAVSIIILVSVGTIWVLYFSPGTIKINSILPLSNDSSLTVSLLSAPEMSLNPSETFNVVLNLSSIGNAKIETINTPSPGFTITSINSSLPLSVNANTPVLVTIKAPNYAYQGMLVLNMNVSVQSESFVVRYFMTDWKKSIYNFSVFNDGYAPVQLVKMYLVRSDGLVVNSTDLSLPSVSPGQVGSFNCSISYDLATASELYHIKLVSADGVVGVSLDEPITCNCTH